MGEEYIGVKFRVVYLHGESPGPKRLLEIDKTLVGLLKPEKNEGNLSIRLEDGILISSAGAKITELKDAVFVKRIERDNVYVMGGTPSSETIMHWEVYQNRKDVNIILHFHDEGLLEKEFEHEVGPMEYGTMELAKAVGEAGKKSDIIKIKEHGFIVLAKDREDLNEKLTKMLSE